MHPIRTIGHSNLTWPAFLNLLQEARVHVVIDVRSRPVSRWAHFSRPALHSRLDQSGISYLWLGAELGGRPPPGEALDYESAAKTNAFREGLAQCEEIAARASVALMCSEHEPCACHRVLLVGRRLAERGHPLEHILRDGRIEQHAATEDRLLAMARLTEADLLASREDRLARAYDAQRVRIAGKK